MTTKRRNLAWQYASLVAMCVRVRLPLKAAPSIIHCRLIILTFSMAAIASQAAAESAPTLNVEYLAKNAVERVPERVPRTLTRNLINLFEPAKMTISAGDMNNVDELYFRIFKPKITAGVRYPLLVWLHGYGPKELLQPNVGQLEYLQELIFHDPIHPEKYRFFVVAPHCSPNNDLWFPDPIGDTKEPALMPPGDATILLVKDLCERYPIDPNRIYLSGVSYGGTSCWKMALQAPDLFAAVVPMASAGVADYAELHTIKNVPIWAFHSVGDGPEPVEKTVEALAKAGGRCQLTLIPGAAHNCWIPAYQQHQSFEGMLFQVRGSATSPSPPEFEALLERRRTYEAFLAGLPTFAIAALIGATIFWELRRQKRRALDSVQGTGT